MFQSYDHLQAEIYTLEINYIDNGSVVFRMEDEIGGACSTNGEKRNAYRLLGKPEERRPLGRQRRRRVDYIGMDLVQVGWGDVDWIGLAQDRNRWRALVNSVLNLLVP
jgi:hypothetical protein